MRKRVAERKLVTGLIDDVENGACSVLEQGYLHRVERAHGLPAAERQHSSRATGGRTYQDVRYGEFGLLVELDGLAFHDSPEARDSDALRDLAECATSADITVRLTYGLVFTHGCRTARWLVQILRRRGWHGAPHPCPACAPNP